MCVPSHVPLRCPLFVVVLCLKAYQSFEKQINDDDDGDMEQSAECESGLEASSEEADISNYSVHQFSAKDEVRNLIASDDRSLSSMRLVIPWAVATERRMRPRMMLTKSRSCPL